MPLPLTPWESITTRRLGRLYSRFGCCGEEKNSWPVLGI